jgi:hypothetical protein
MKLTLDVNLSIILNNYCAKIVIHYTAVPQSLDMINIVYGTMKNV